MEKWKAFWAAFLHWPGWTGWPKWSGWAKIARWKGWTAWLTWSGWKKIGAWNGWGKLLFPHRIVTALLTVVSALGLGWVFLEGQENSIAAYLIYCTAFYVLVVLTAGVVKAAPEMIAWYKQKKSAKNTFGKSKYVGQFVNLIYGGFKVVTGVIQGSAWTGAEGIYNFVQGLIQLYQIWRHKKVTDVRGQWKAYRQCGYMMILSNLTMTGLVFQMIHMGRHKNTNEIMIIATAAFTFYKLISRFVTLAKDRKHEHPVESAVHFLDFTQALYNLFVLQVGLLWAFGGDDFAYQKLMNSLTGSAVCLLVCGTGIYMIWRARRDMRKLEDTEIG